MTWSTLGMAVLGAGIGMAIVAGLILAYDGWCSRLDRRAMERERLERAALMARAHRENEEAVNRRILIARLAEVDVETARRLGF